MTSEERLKYMKLALKEMEESLARRVALIDQMQAAINTKPHLFTEEQLREHQAYIDTHQANIKLDRITLNKKKAYFKLLTGEARDVE